MICEIKGPQVWWSPAVHDVQRPTRAASQAANVPALGGAKGGYEPRKMELLDSLDTIMV